MNIDILSSPTPIRTRHGYYVQRGDFEAICHGNMAAVAALRALETQTTQRIKELRAALDIPADQWPHDELLWLGTEYSAMVALVRHVRGRSSLERALCDTPKAAAAQRVTLQSLGFVKSRYVAYADDDVVPVEGAQRDREGRSFLVVMNMQGWVEQGGDLHLAADLGYSRVAKQYLYCFDAINAAISALDGVAYTPLPRWTPPRTDAPPLQKTTGDVAASETTKSAEESHTAPQKDTLLSAAQGGTLKTPESGVSVCKNTITDTETQEVTEFSPEVLLSLVSSVLFVPARDTVSDEVWQRDWLGPACVWMQRTDVAPRLQYGGPLHPWALLEVVLRYMTTPGSPSWWVQKRAKQTSVTLRHVVANYDVQLADLRKRGWSPPPVVPAAPDDAAPSAASPALCAEVPGMSEAEADALEAEMAADCPGIVLSRGTYEEYPGVAVPGFAIGPGDFIDLWSREDWHYYVNERPDIIRRAMRYASSVGPPDGTGPVVA